MNKDLLVGIISVIGCVLVHLTLGYFYTVGNITPYIQDYMGITSSQTIWINSVMLSCQAISMPIGGILCEKIGFRYVTLIAMVLSSGGVLLTRLTVDAGFGPFIVTYSIMFGTGIGLPYSVLFSIASNWFPSHRAVIVGIISAGFGMGALIFTPIQSALINPESLQDFTDQSIKDRIPNAFLIIGGILLGIQIIGLILIRENKPKKDDNSIEMDDSITPYEENSMKKMTDSELEIASFDSEKPEIVKSFTVMEALKTIDFYLLVAIAFLDAIPINLLSSTYKKYGKDYYNDDSYLTTMATITSVFNCGGRIIWGAIVDKVSFKCPMGWFLTEWAILFATFPILSTAPQEIFKILYPIWLFALYFTMAGHFSIMPAAATRIFGPKNMSIIYGLIFMSIAPSSLILSAILSQFNIAGKWLEVYLSAAVLSALGFVISLFLKDRNGTCTGVSTLCSKVCDSCRPEPRSDMEDIEEMGSYLSI